MGVEEELLLVGPDGAPRDVAATVLAADDSLEEEIQSEQVETATVPCETAGALRAELVRRRRNAIDAARTAGAGIVPLGAPPVAVEPHVSPEHRYRRMIDEYGRVASEQLTCGCHVHVEVGTLEEGVGVLDRIGPWLPVLRALAANSPYWQGEDTGYASYRTTIWNRWPSAGPTGPFGSLAGYEHAVAAMLDTGALLDDGMIYFDARLSTALSTVELRVADVCLTVEDAVLVASLARGLVATASRAWADGEPPSVTRHEVLALTHWRAARSGLDGVLVNPVSGRPAPAGAVVGALREHVADALDEAGDTDLVEKGCERLLSEGTGAAVQRALAAEHDGDLAAMVAAVLSRTDAAS